MYYLIASSGGEGRDGYRDQIVTCDVGMSAFQHTLTVHIVW